MATLKANVAHMLQEDRAAQEKLSTLAVRLVSVIEVVDRINADGKEMDMAAATFDDILKVPPSTHHTLHTRCRAPHMVSSLVSSRV